MPNYYISGADPADEVSSYHYLALVGCILVIGLTLFMGTTITWSGDRMGRQELQSPLAIQLPGQASTTR